MSPTHLTRPVVKRAFGSKRLGVLQANVPYPVTLLVVSLITGFLEAKSQSSSPVQQSSPVHRDTHDVGLP